MISNILLDDDIVVIMITWDSITDKVFCLQLMVTTAHKYGQLKVFPQHSGLTRYTQSYPWCLHLSIFEQFLDKFIHWGIVNWQHLSLLGRISYTYRGYHSCCFLVPYCRCGITTSGEVMTRHIFKSVLTNGFP